MEQLALGLVGLGVLASLAVLAPAVARGLAPPASPAAAEATPAPTPPPAAVLLPEETERDLQGVMILVNDHTFGTAFEVDARGRFLTAASLVGGSSGLRLVDNSGGSHAVSVIGVDAALGVAEIQSAADGVPLAIGTSSVLSAGEPLVLLASQKVANLRTATPVVTSTVGEAAITLRADDLPGNIGGPLVGPGGSVLALFTAHGAALPIGAIARDLAAWQDQAGLVKPLAPLPADLVLRGSEDTSAPTTGVTVQSVTPNRTSSAQTTLVTLQGSGFLPGTRLAVRFVPVASPSGAFPGLSPTLVSPSAITVKVPAGAVVQDYVIELTNGDGGSASYRVAFSVTP